MSKPPAQAWRLGMGLPREPEPVALPGISLRDKEDKAHIEKMVAAATAEFPYQPTLRVEFTYDHATGMYAAHLDNGATIPVRGDEVRGKLANALTLFARQVIALQPDRTPRIATKGANATYGEDRVRRFTRSGLPELSLDDLDL